MLQIHTENITQLKFDRTVITATANNRYSVHCTAQQKLTKLCNYKLNYAWQSSTL